MVLKKAILLVAGGLDVANLALANTPTLTGLDSGLAMGVVYSDSPADGEALSLVAHAVMGTGTYAVLPLIERPAARAPRKLAMETVGHVARREGLLTAAVGADQAALVLGGTDVIDFSFLQSDGVDPLDVTRLKEWSACILNWMERGLVVIHYSGVEYCARRRDIQGVGEAVELADWLAGELAYTLDLNDSLVVVVGDRGISPHSGQSSMAPTPLALIGGGIPGRAFLGVVRHQDMALTLSSALGLAAPLGAGGRDLYSLALGKPPLPFPGATDKGLVIEELSPVIEFKGREHARW